ncbi:MAG: Spy/CpxP family protein refolding chaperone [Gammaproteobacteria bacterium]
MKIINTKTAGLLIAGIVTAAAITTSALAGGPRGLDRMAENLGLSDAQRSQIEAIYAERKEQRKAMREETRNQIEAILTEEQRAKMSEMRQMREERMARRHGEGGPGEGKGRHGQHCKGGERS